MQLNGRLPVRLRARVLAVHDVPEGASVGYNATWRAERTPRAFLDRHAGGVRFSRLPRPPREDALRVLAAWAQSEFGTLDARFTEIHRFEMQLFSFAEG